jgi:urease
MKLLPRELDKLALIQAGNLAQRRLARGIQLNHVEATALICTVLLEHVRDGKLSLSEIQTLGANLLGKRLVLPQTWSTLDHVSLEATFPDGTKLITGILILKSS